MNTRDTPDAVDLVNEINSAVSALRELGYQWPTIKYVTRQAVNNARAWEKQHDLLRDRQESDGRDENDL